MVKFNNSRKLARKKTPSLKTWGLWALSAFLIAIIAIAVLEITNTTHFFHKSIPATKIVVKSGKPTPTPLSNVSGSSSPDSKTLTNNNGTSNSGASTDTGGTAVATTNQNQWVVSQSGNITLKQPIADSTLQNGATITGSATNISQVSFRLIDNKVGVIDQGTLNVTNGNFSGILYFKPQATSGQLDVFSTDSNAVEINEIQESINF
jgi:hypothetical protein